MVPASVRSARLVCVFLLAVLLFNYPLLAVFNAAGTVAGVPLLYAYLFAAWLVVIVAAALAVRRLA
jgi:hypothetical protein